ncbi:MAG: class I SAM-dependent methyltransferase [Candidatus Aureabacteria bacterium]|nr:class I SAM-dependent methyltransferase [Candidatus Auribacterota bacterium]
MYYYSSEKTWENSFWLGYPTLKCPLDMWIYQEILCKIQPEVIIETGTYCGGSTLYLAMICDMLKKGDIISIDVEEIKERPFHPRIKYFQGSSIATDTIKIVKHFISARKKIMVILDSDHSKKHVLQELKIYSQFVDVSSYLIVEDTDFNGHPVKPEFGPGPMEAVEEFLKSNPHFSIDYSREKLLLTQNPKGYLKRIS